MDQVYTESHGFDQIPLFEGMHIAINQGDGTAQTLDWEQDVDVPGFVDYADLSGDGVPDLVMVDSDKRQPALIVALGVGSGLPIQEGRYPLAGRGGNVLTGDVDNDGDTDVVVFERAVEGQGGVHVLLNRLHDRITAVTEGAEAATGGSPVAAQLLPAYPNPFNPSLEIPFVLGRDVTDVRLVVYNILGQPVRTLVDEPLAAGEHRVFWDGRDDEGHALPTGVYFHRLETPYGVVCARSVRME